MKAKYLMIGFLLGFVACVLIVFTLISQPLMANRVSKIGIKHPVQVWPDSLDAAVADPKHHKVIFENQKLRILEEYCAPYAVESVHTHRWPSIMWTIDSSFTNSKLVYYQYAFDSSKKNYYIKDSLVERAPMPNRGYSMAAESPHKVANLSDMSFRAYRVELKN